MLSATPAANEEGGGRGDHVDDAARNDEAFQRIAATAASATVPSTHPIPTVTVHNEIRRRKKANKRE